MRSFEHIDATSVQDAIAILRSETDSLIIAGGTDLLVLMKNRLLNPRVLVNVKTIDGLDRIREDGANHLAVGPMVTLATLGGDPVLQRDLPIVAQAISLAASPQLRHMATVAGNLCQRPRCWHYRGPFECFLKGGSGCPAASGEGRDAAIFGAAECYAVNPSDLAPPLVALGASVVLATASGRREIPLAQFLVPPNNGRHTLTMLGREEMIVEIRIPRRREASQGVYLKAMERQAWSFAQASVAIQLVQADAVVSDVSIVMGGVAAIPWRARWAEEILRGQKATPQRIEDAVAAVVEGARPLGHGRFRAELAQALLRRGLSILLGPVGR